MQNTTACRFKSACHGVTEFHHRTLETL